MATRKDESGECVCGEQDQDCMGDFQCNICASRACPFGDERHWRKQHAALHGESDHGCPSCEVDAFAEFMGGGNA